MWSPCAIPAGGAAGAQALRPTPHSRRHGATSQKGYRGAACASLASGRPYRESEREQREHMVRADHMLSEPYCRTLQLSHHTGHGQVQHSPSILTGRSIRTSCLKVYTILTISPAQIVCSSQHVGMRKVCPDGEGHDRKIRHPHPLPPIVGRKLLPAIQNCGKWNYACPRFDLQAFPHDVRIAVAEQARVTEGHSESTG